VKQRSDQALRDKLGVDFGFQNRGGVRDKLPRGKILARHIWNIHPFDNQVVIGRFSSATQISLTSIRRRSDQGIRLYH
jgi:2',3'-cyclic-nucleotide 2'-phosphodiesterase (5'-nucleotidase family)